MECFARHKKTCLPTRQGKNGTRLASEPKKKIKPPTNQNQSNKNQPKCSLSFPLKARRRGVEKEEEKGKDGRRKGRWGAGNEVKRRYVDIFLYASPQSYH